MLTQRDPDLQHAVLAFPLTGDLAVWSILPRRCAGNEYARTNISLQHADNSTGRVRMTEVQLRV